MNDNDLQRDLQKQFVFNYRLPFENRKLEYENALKKYSKNYNCSYLLEENGNYKLCIKKLPAIDSVKLKELKDNYYNYCETEYKNAINKHKELMRSIYFEEAIIIFLRIILELCKQNSNPTSAQTSPPQQPYPVNAYSRKSTCRPKS